LLIFPIFGSAIAAVASYFTRNGRTRRLRLLQRVLELVRKAPTAASLEALDKMQSDVHQLVVAIIHQGEREEYDQSVQMSFSLALDQVRFAIASRRAVLLGQGATDAKPDSKPDAKPDSERDAKADSEAKPESEPDTKPDAEPDAKLDSEPHAKPDAERDANPNTSKAAAA
jgi:hypothetical protein